MENVVLEHNKKEKFASECPNVNNMYINEPIHNAFRQGLS